MTYTILVADQEPAIGKLIEAVLSSKGGRVLKVSQGFEAWRSLREEKPDAAVLELRLPMVNGLELIRAIRGNPDLKHMKLVLCTGDREVNIDDLASLPGVDGVLRKPFTLDEVTNLFPAATIAKRVV